MFLELVSIGVFGLIFGGIFGMMAGVYSGIGMAMITSLFFSDIISRNIYKIVMGIITAICSGLFFSSGLWHLRLDGINVTSWNATLSLAILLAVYASQRVTTDYLNEWSLRKYKAQIQA